MARDSFMQAAFDKVCENAVQATGFYVVLMGSSPYYGGPEEGGWYGTDNVVVAYKYYDTKEAAEAAQDKVVKLAEELKKSEQASYGEYCARTTEWLEERGLEPDFLPEPDGPSDFYVIVTETLPESSFGSRQYS